MSEGRAEPGYVWLCMDEKQAWLRSRLLARLGALVASLAVKAEAGWQSELTRMRMDLADFEEALDGAIEAAG